MKICDSCGTIGGGHTAFCKYQKRDPEMLDIHESHKMMKGGCLNCERSDVAGLVLECSGAPMGAAKPTFPVDSSHETKLIEGTWTCTFCSGTDLRVLKHACPRVPKSEVAIHTSHDIGESGYCVNCAKHKTMDVYMEKPCPKAPENFNFAAVEVHPSHRIKWADGKPVNCEACGASNALELTTDCVNASPARRIGGPRRRFEPNLRYNKGVLLSNETVWAVYYWEQSPMVLSIHARPEQAINANTDRNSIFPWKLGTDFGEAVRAWESRNTAEEKKE